MVPTIHQKPLNRISKQLNYCKPKKNDKHRHNSSEFIGRENEFGKIGSYRINAMGSQSQFYVNIPTHNLKFIGNPYPSNWAEISASVKYYSRFIYRENNLRNSLSSVSSKDLEITIDRINKLADEEDDDEYGEITHPTTYANQLAIELVSKAASFIPQGFFRAWVSSDDSGGIRLTWSKLELGKEVRLVVSSTPQKKIHLYHEMGDEYGIEYNVSAKTLSRWLSWCNPK
jgi:hypothetical protein